MINFNPDLIENVQKLYDILANEFNTTPDGIRSSFRTVLKPLNRLKDNANVPKFSIFNFFEKNEDVTPKHFLDVSIYYLQNKKYR